MDHLVHGSPLDVVPIHLITGTGFAAVGFHPIGMLDCCWAAERATIDTVLVSSSSNGGGGGTLFTFILTTRNKSNRIVIFYHRQWDENACLVLHLEVPRL